MGRSDRQSLSFSLHNQVECRAHRGGFLPAEKHQVLLRDAQSVRLRIPEKHRQAPSPSLQLPGNAFLTRLHLRPCTIKASFILLTFLLNICY
jgi:hypothetical protein